MNILYILLLYCLFFVQGALAQSEQSINFHSDEESFLKAQALYHKKNYDKALSLYTSIAFPSAGVLYNKGNTLYQLKQYPQALASLRRAQRHASFSLLKDINYTIDLLLTACEKNNNQSAIASIGMYARSLFPPLLLQMLIIFVLIALTVLIMRRRYHVKLMLLLVLIGICSSAILTYSYSIDGQKYGIVNAADVVLYAGPGDSYARVGSLCQLDHVAIGKQEDTWYKIRHADLTGWVSAQALEVV